MSLRLQSLTGRWSERLLVPETPAPALRPDPLVSRGYLLIAAMDEDRLRRANLQRARRRA